MWRASITRQPLSSKWVEHSGQSNPYRQAIGGPAAYLFGWDGSIVWSMSWPGPWMRIAS
jgi:hypothetical protein